MSLFLTVQAFSLIHLSIITADVDAESEFNDFPKSSGLISYSIVINDTDPALSWSAWDAKNPSWLSGNGLQDSPYKIQDVLIDGRGNNESCIVIKNTRAYFELDNVTCKNAAAGGLIMGGLYIYNSTNGNVTDSFFLDNAEAGIQLENSTDCAFEKNYIEGGNKYGFLSEEYCKRIDFTGNIVNQTISESVYVTNGSWFNIENNWVDKSLLRGISLDYVDNSTVIGNNITLNAYEAIYLNNKGGDNLIKGNFINRTEPSSMASGIYINGNAPKNIKRVEISDNKIYDVDDEGIMVQNSEWVTVSNNYIDNSNAFGIEVRDSLNATIYENLINKTGSHGIYIGSNSHSANITRNIVLNASSAGIHVIESDFCTVHWNDVNGSGGFGLSFNGLDYSYVTYNTVYYCTVRGFIFGGAPGTGDMFYFNNLINNRYGSPTLSQADSGDLGFTFNSSTHGNYWSNHLLRYPSSVPNPDPNDYYYNFGYDIDGGYIDNRSLVEQTRGPLSWPMVAPTLDVTPVSALVNKVRCAIASVQWNVEYDGSETHLNYKIYVNDTLIKTSSISREEISGGILYQNSTLYDGDWKVSIVVYGGLGLQDSSDVLVHNIQPLTITVAEYPKTAFEAGNTIVIINWTVTNDASLILTKLVLYINNTISATLLVGTETGHWNYSALKPYYVFNNLSLFPVGVYNIRILIYYTIDGNTCYWGSETITINITEGGFWIPGYDVPLLLGITTIAIVVLFRKKRKNLNER